MKLRTSSSHEEGVERDWAVTTKRFDGDGKGNVRALVAARVEWQKDPVTGAMKMAEVPGSEFELPADLVLFAMGFVAPVGSVLEAFGVEKDARGNARAADRRRQGWRSAPTRPMCRRCSPPATCAAARAWSCGRSGKGVNARAQSTNS